MMSFTEFMRICRKAQRMCQASKKQNAVVNAAALDELMDMDICLRVHRTYKRMGTLRRGLKRECSYTCSIRVKAEFVTQ